MINVFIQNIEKVSSQEYEEFFLELPKEMQVEVSKYQVKEDRQRTLVGKMLLLNLLKQYSSSNLFDIKRTKYNKPYLENSSNCFNISHSGKYVICAFSYNNPIGIDIEELNSNIDINDFEEVLLTNEYDSIQNSKDPLKLFYTIWTKKEALLKAEGKGLMDNIKAIKIKNDKIYFNNKKYFCFVFEFENFIFSLVSLYKDDVKIFS